MELTGLIEGVDLLKNVKLFPIRQLVIANDKIAEMIFGFSDKEFKAIKRIHKFSVVETISKQHGKIATPIEITTKSEVPFNQFDRAVLSVMMSQYLAGYSLLTYSIIYRALCGKFNTSSSVVNPTEAQREAIRLSIDKMRLTSLTADLSKLTKHLNYNNHKSVDFSANLLSCRRVSGVTINGQSSNAIIQVEALSPIYGIAQLKKQLLTCDVALLGVPKQHNSVEIIGIKHYVLQRVLEIIAHKMAPTITFADIFEKCNVVTDDNKKKLRLRKYIYDVFEHLKNCGKIKSFEFEKFNGAFFAIKFKYNKKA